MVEQLTLGIIIVAALADSINPCVFGVLIFLLAYMTAIYKNKKKMLLAALIYVSAVYITYFLIGMGIFTLTYTAGMAKYFYWFAAIIAILAGLFEVKDYFWYGKGFSLQIIPGGVMRLKSYIRVLKNVSNKHPTLSFLIAFLIGVFVVFVELPCTGAPYLVILGLLSSGDYYAGIPLLLLYNLIFILPLFIIIGLVYAGKTSRALEKWRKKYRGLMRMLIGLFLIALGAYMVWAVI
ncbi:sulfite exporter TauE/SafE family protein [Candidatus Woesearchaeota archaeon]|nr:sulfite exporter TauE/SafE family protein [Candidatus Woesearchaeota archaeon]